MKIEKDGIIKDVADNIVADYKSAGWKIYEEPKIKIYKRIINFSIIYYCVFNN